MSTWVLLRGLMREARHWGDFPPRFAQACGAQRLLTPDFAGNGSLSHLPSAASVPEMLAQLRRDLQMQGYPPPYHVLALSLGAMVALAWAQTWPQEVQGLVLINTSVRPYNRFYQRLRPANYARLLGGLLRGSASEFEAIILAVSSNLLPAARRSEVLAEWQGYAREHPVARSNIVRQLCAAMRFRAAAQAPQMPLLLLAAQHDRLVSVQCSQMLARAWQAKLALHPQAGHDLPLDDGAWVIQQVQAWLGSAA